MSTKIIDILKPAIKELTITLVGDTSLITHPFSEKIKKEFEGRNQGRAKTKKTPQNPQEEYANSLYWLDKSDFLITPGKDPSKHKFGFGFPSSGVKKASISACRCFSKEVKMTEMKSAFHIYGEKNSEYIALNGVPQMRTDIVRVGGKGPGTGVPDLRYRAEFLNWSARIKVKYNANMITEEMLFNLINTGGFAAGLGEQRPEKCGTNGMYHVE